MATHPHEKKEAVAHAPAHEPHKKEAVVREGSDDAFRRQAALEILGAYVARHGGFEPAAMDAHIRRIWEYADAFVASEHAPPPTPEPEPEPPKPGRKADPTDEWGVRDGDVLRKGFVTREEAEFYAAARPGSKVVQVAGPEMAGVVATA